VSREDTVSGDGPVPVRGQAPAAPSSKAHAHATDDAMEAGRGTPLNAPASGALLLEKAAAAHPRARNGRAY